jgi:UDP-N-acetylmuramoyl-L-alanyl-D-glutamate--2,6-diaminopimelate ligase
MTHVDEGQSFDVVVDYAHTPDSFEKLFSELKPLVKGRIISVFGSAGRRDEAKRATQGEIAGKYSNVVIATEEDDRDCDGQEILQQIASGVEMAGKKTGKDLLLIHKREDAVAKAIKIAKAGDLVLFLGKGHEKNILTSGPKAAELRHLPQDDTDKRRVIRRPYSEIEVVRKILKGL